VELLYKTVRVADVGVTLPRAGKHRPALNFPFTRKEMTTEFEALECQMRPQIKS
jgi:hypothetical protein